MPPLLMLICAAIGLHAFIGSLLMLLFIRNETCRFLWIKMPLFDFLRLWLAFAFGWTYAIYNTLMDKPVGLGGGDA